MLLLFFIFLFFCHFHNAISAHCTTVTSSKTFEKCMTFPTQQTSMAWTFHKHNSTLDLVFFGAFISPSGWVGWGINPTSPEMAGTRALIAFPDPNSGQLVVLPYILDPTVKLQKSPLLSRPLDVHLLSSSATLYGGKMASIHNGAAVQIYATIRLSPNKTKLHFVWNRGLYVQGYSPTIHPTTSNDLSSIATIDVLSGFNAAHKDNTRMLKIIHGIANAISWGVLLPTGAVTARYLRHIQALGPAWFYAHAGIQLSAFLLGTVGFAIGIRLGESSPGVVYSLHRKLGFAVFCLGALQTLALLFRPKTTNKYRKYWKSYHHFVGYACVVLGVVNVFQGFEVLGEGRSYAKLGYCLCLSTLVGASIALEVNSWVIFCRKSKEEKMRREGLISVSDKVSVIHN
ncbi:cytochrome b561 and DOMON domain-containing protein At2g04850 [Ricinus communis]|uniref:Cytochrome b561 and DOMON domain-containing protein n=1 Tax=Ricinus communis TaxID=3988 RepID=B9T190_RICCO|nr:cytochrome b561 and DOMON domain-containing protein At2g04850 [Ricinus communis]EEF30382.1 dopamine beta-monooxygenase, putative [Ricinus communis]|eukprot:XP_002532009.1 cytochrome b561 and DOMON domain-containing protein At2g04850 [Ricinus communis]